MSRTTIDAIMSVAPFLIIQIALPFLIIRIALYFVLAYPIIRRKGRSLSGPTLLFFVPVPFLSFFVVLFHASLTDKDVLDRLAALEAKPTSLKSSTSPHQLWWQS